MGWLLAGATPEPVTPTRVLTDIREIRALSPEQAAAGRPVSVRGIVTRVTPYELFIQNGPDAIFSWQTPARNAGLHMGDRVEINGITHSGHLLPVIMNSVITVIDHPGLPVAQIVRHADLASGRSDCQWVEVSGVVRTVDVTPWKSISLRILFDGQPLRIELSEPSDIASAQLLGARLRLRGVISGAKTPQRRVIEPVLWGSYRPDTFMIESPGPADVFAAPLCSVDALHEQGGSSRAGEMARVRGAVTSQPSPSLVFLRDGLRNLEIRLQQPVALAVGDRIEAVGFPEMGLVQPVLQSAFARRLAAGAPPPPLRLSAAQLLDFRHESELVAVEGELREIFHHNKGLLLLVADADKAFSVDVEAALLNPAGELPPVGSRLALVGISQIDRITPPDIYQIVAPASARLRLRSLAEMRVLSRPPWWTPRHLLTAVALLSLLILGTLGWIWMLDRRVRAQTRIILSKAQNEAMLEERNRIAREFHDTVEQHLAGATILLDAIASMVMEQPERARHGLNTARAMLRHSLEEAQQAVSDLRNNDLFEHDLKPLIEASVRERLQNTSIAVDFRYDGTWPDLDAVVKKHLLRIVQESVTNAIKHAAPTRIAVVMLAAQDRIELQVTDDGCGFAVQGRNRHGPGEFGLVGLQERAEKIGANLTIQSAPQRGTTITLSLQRTALAL